MAPRTNHAAKIPEPKQSIEERVLLYSERYSSGKDIWTGKTLEKGYGKIEIAPEDDVQNDE